MLSIPDSRLLGSQGPALSEVTLLSDRGGSDFPGGAIICADFLGRWVCLSVWDTFYT